MPGFSFDIKPAKNEPQELVELQSCIQKQEQAETKKGPLVDRLGDFFGTSGYAKASSYVHAVIGRTVSREEYNRKKQSLTKMRQHFHQAGIKPYMCEDVMLWAGKNTHPVYMRHTVSREDACRLYDVAIAAINGRPIPADTDKERRMRNNFWLG